MRFLALIALVAACSKDSPPKGAQEGAATEQAKPTEQADPASAAALSSISSSSAI